MTWTAWGWAGAGEKVSVRLDDRAIGTAIADGKGNWRVNFEPLKADGGKPHTLTFTGKNSITLDDLVIGEVWLASGQSNMARSVGKAAAREVEQPAIRLLQVPAVLSKTVAQDVAAQWTTCTPETAADFSAVAYYFGRRLHDELKVPIGLINASRGSTAIEQFLPGATPGQRGGVLFNGSIAPLHPIAIRGVIWYQGEANVKMNDGLRYAPKMKSLIEGWRNCGAGPFHFTSCRSRH